MSNLILTKKKLSFKQLSKFLKNTTKRIPGQAEKAAFKAIYPNPLIKKHN